MLTLCGILFFNFISGIKINVNMCSVDDLLYTYMFDVYKNTSFSISVSSPYIQQMHSTLMLIGLTFLLALANNIIPTIPSITLQVVGFCFQIVERVAVLTSLFAFLMHV